MNLSEKKLQELKDNKISIEDLNDQYFINSQYRVEVENILKLLNENICSFEELVDKIKSIKNQVNVPCLYRLLWNEKFFEKLTENNTLNKEDLEYLLNRIDEWYELDNLIENTFLLKHIVENELFKELVDKYKSIEENDNNPCLYKLLYNKELFEELIKNNKLNKDDLEYLLNKIDDVDYELFALRRNTPLIKEILNEIVLNKELVDKYKNFDDLHRLIDNEELLEELIDDNLLTKDDLKYLLNKIDSHHELCSLNRNTSLLTYTVENDILSFKELVNTFKNIEDSDDASCLWRLLDNKELFEELIKNTKLTKDDLEYLLNQIGHRYDLDFLCKNTSLIKRILNDFILNKDDVDKFNEIIEEIDWCKKYNIHTIFEMIEDHNENNEEVLKLNKLNKSVYSFDLTKDQKSEIVEVLRDNEQAQNTLTQIVDANLEDQYDFEKLKNLLTKDEEKKKLKMNF